MNHCVPDFQMDEDYPIPSLSRPRKGSSNGDEIMELLWQNGQVVMQSQRSIKKSAPPDFADELMPDQSHHHQQQQQQQEQHHQNLFMQEDEMASWLHYPLNDTAFVNDFCSDLLYSSSPCVNTTATGTATAPPTATTTTTATATTATASASAIRAPVVVEPRHAAAAPRPPIPPSRRLDNFGHLSRLSKAHRIDEVGGYNLNRAMNDSTVVDSSDTPAVRPKSRVAEARADRDIAARGTVGSGAATPAASSAGADTEAATCEMTVTSSPGGSSASAEPPTQKVPPVAPPEDRKRKGRDPDITDWHSEDIELESADTKKHVRASTSTKRSRAAEVHNLSERRRRDRINEKMKALQELIPHCNKADKASMLDEAIEYLKSLQSQVQMMSMGCSMVPMVFPGVQQYMPHMAMGMGMGMGMDMGMNRPMMPFPNVLAGSLLTPAAGAHLARRFPMPAFHMQPVSGADPSKIPPNDHSDPMLSSLVMQNPNHPRIPGFVDPYQQYLGLRHMQFPPQQVLQNQASQHGTSKPNTSKGVENLERQPSG